jgi:hypothetical protein
MARQVWVIPPTPISEHAETGGKGSGGAEDGSGDEGTAVSSGISETEGDTARRIPLLPTHLSAAPDK